MSMPKGDQWIQVEWNSGERSLVNARYLVKSLPRGEELHVGKVVTVGKNENGAPLTATVLASAHDRERDEPTHRGEAGEPTAGTTPKEELQDFSPSGSDWQPSSDSCTEESEEDESRKIKLERSRIRQDPMKTLKSKKKNIIGKRVLTPSLRPKPVVPNGVKQHDHDTPQEGVTVLHDSARSNQQDGENTLMAMFEELFKNLAEIKELYGIQDTGIPMSWISDICHRIDSTDTDMTDHSTKNVSEGAPADVTVDMKEDSDYSSKSDDNVLITNKYVNVNEVAVNKKNQETGHSEWVPIGSGMTLIHKDKFKKVNWKSYTIATRTLLLAVFSRRTLATHSLTGKKSPAFTNKPAKMCLDPKKVSDIVIEICDKFQVKSNLVRSIITTKCADECKMLKMKTAKKGNNRENIPPA